MVVWINFVDFLGLTSFSFLAWLNWPRGVSKVDCIGRVEFLRLSLFTDWCLLMMAPNIVQAGSILIAIDGENNYILNLFQLRLTNPINLK